MLGCTFITAQSRVRQIAYTNRRKTKTRLRYGAWRRSFVDANRSHQNRKSQADLITTAVIASDYSDLAVVSRNSLAAGVHSVAAAILCQLPSCVAGNSACSAHRAVASTFSQATRLPLPAFASATAWQAAAAADTAATTAPRLMYHKRLMMRRIDDRRPPLQIAADPPSPRLPIFAKATT
jgi:hypothetical protein